MMRFLPHKKQASPGSMVKRRAAQDQLARRVFYGLIGLPIFLVGVIFIALIYRSWPILATRPLGDLILGLNWHPSQGQFGFLPFISATFYVTLLAMILAVPVCLLTSIYLSEYARPRVREVVKPMLDLMAAIPSVVYGVWGMIAIVPVVQYLNPWAVAHLGFLPFFNTQNPTGFSVLAGSIVLAVMVMPFIIAVTFEVLRNVPDGYREASLAVGATRWETVKYAVLPKVPSGILAGVVFGMSRALGETMAVMMVVGNVVKIPVSIFDPAYPLPALIANNYGEMLSIPLYDAALMVAALILLSIVLASNVLSALLLNRIIGKSLLS